MTGTSVKEILRRQRARTVSLSQRLEALGLNCTSADPDERDYFIDEDGEYWWIRMSQSGIDRLVSLAERAPS